MSSVVTFITGTKVVWGAETSLLTLARHMKDEHDVRLICSSEDLAQEWHAQVGSTVQMKRSPGGRVSRLRGFLSSIARELPRDSTIVVFDYYLLPAIFWYRRRLARMGIRIVVDVHDSARSNPLRKPYFWLMSTADHIIAISEYIAQEMPRGTPVSVIHRPVSAPERAVAGTTPTDASSVAVVGQITPEKRVLEAVGLLEEDPKLCLEIRGAAPSGYEQYLGKIMSRGGEHGNRFRYRGRVPSAEATLGISFLLLANPAEPFGRVVAEAQLAGVVPVVPSTGGASELVEHGVNGLVYPPLEMGTAARLIRLLIDDPESLERVRARARTDALAAYDPKAIAGAYLTVLCSERLASRRSQP